MNFKILDKLINVMVLIFIFIYLLTKKFNQKLRPLPLNDFNYFYQSVRFL